MLPLRYHLCWSISLSRSYSLAVKCLSAKCIPMREGKRGDIFISVYLYIYILIYLYVYIYTYVCIFMYIYMHVYLYISILTMEFELMFSKSTHTL